VAVTEGPGGGVPRSDMLRDFFLGFIKIHILHHAGEEPVYGLALIGELRRHGYELSPGTLYPVLHQLEKSGYLRRLDRVVNGKVRKYYRLTRRGGVGLDDARRKIGELVDEVLEGRGARRGVRGRKGRGQADAGDGRGRQAMKRPIPGRTRRRSPIGGVG
jgi:DNA-binding PadR family transcriptional regulator